jgi:hypothetical protein
MRKKSKPKQQMVHALVLSLYESTTDLSSTNSPVPPVCLPAQPATSFSGFLVKMNSAPALTKLPTPTTTCGQTGPRPKTALDILNDTIIKSLGPSSTPTYPVTSSSYPVTSSSYPVTSTTFPVTSSTYPVSSSPAPLNLVPML